MFQKLKDVLTFFLGATLLSAPSFVDSPFYTDDPEFSPGWEIKVGVTGEHNSNSSVVTDVLDWHYAVLKNLRLNLTTYSKHVNPKGGSFEFGYGDTEFKTKWRFVDPSPENAMLSLGIAPKIFIPTASKSRGFVTHFGTPQRGDLPLAECSMRYGILSAGDARLI